jgi:NAD(P) transhydrogenase subunit alpha
VTDTVWDCDAVVAVRRPDEAALAQMRPGAILVGLLAPLDEPNAIRDIATSGVTAMSFETLPRTTRAQSMDVLSSQATLAGYQMVIEAATRSRAYCP